MESTSDRMMHSFIANTPDEYLTKREAALRKIEPEVRRILAALFAGDLHGLVYGVDSFEEWFFSLNELQREQFVEDSWKGDPGMIVKPIDRFLKEAVSDASRQSNMIRAVRQTVQEATTTKTAAKKTVAGDWPFGLHIDEENLVVSRPDSARDQIISKDLNRMQFDVLFQCITRSDLKIPLRKFEDLVSRDSRARADFTKGLNHLIADLRVKISRRKLSDISVECGGS